ncbi:translocation/assembly module TamB domain-containing protein [Candidatus Mycalebacterium sp.]
MSLFNNLLPRYSVLVFAVFALLCATGFPRVASCVEFFKPEIEKRLRQTLPDFEVSIGEVSTFHEKGIQIKNFSLSKDGQKIARAKSVFVSYGSVISSMLFKDFFSSSAVEIEGLEVFFSPRVRRLLFGRRSLSSASISESENAFERGKLPKIIIKDSVFHFQDGRAEVHFAELSLEGGERKGVLRARIENAHIPLPHVNLSVKNLVLGADIVRAYGGLKISNADGSASLETLRGEPVAEAEFGISIPGDVSNTAWNGRVSLSGISLEGRQAGLSFSSVTFDKNGDLSVYGNIFAGSFTSLIKAQINTEGGGIIPRFGRENIFEIESDVSKGNLPIGGFKLTGIVKKRDGKSVISGKIADGYRNKLDLFGVGELLEDFNFEVALKGGKVASGGLLIKSQKSLLEANFETAGRGAFEVDYSVRSDDVFHLSEVVSFLKPYYVSGGFQSSGKIEKRADGKTFLSGSAKLKDFSATFDKQFHIGGGSLDFRTPLEDFAFEKILLRSSIENVSYAETLLKKANLDFEYGDLYAKLEFENSVSFEFVAEAARKKGRIQADIENIKIKSGDSEMLLSRGFSVELSNEKIELSEMLLYGQGSYLRFSGLYKNTDEPEISVNADFGGVDTSFFEPFYPPLRSQKGLLSGKVSIAGATGLPAAKIGVKYESVLREKRADLSVVRAQHSKLFSVKLTIEDDISGGFLRAGANISPVGVEIYKIRELLSGSSEYDFNLSAKNFSIKPIGILSGKIQDLDGVFSGDLAVLNDGGDFSVKGAIDIETVKMKIGEWTELMEINSTRMDFDGDKMRAAFNLADAYGEAKGLGSFNFRDFSYNCKVELSGIYLHIKHLYSGFYGTVFIDGKGRNLRVRGDGLKTEGANIWLKKDYNIAVEGLVFIDSPESGFAEGKKPDFFSRTADLDFRLLISKDTKFRLDRVDALLSGELHVLRTPGDDFTSVNGELNVFRGSYRILGKRFAVDKGAISFFTREYLSPIVDINAFYERTGLSVKASLHGEANDLKLQLSSTPAMNEDEIILALLVGSTVSGTDDKRASDIIEEVRDRRPGGSLTFGYVADELFSSVVEGGNLFNFVDVLSIKREGAGMLESDIEVGAYVTDRLYFTYERINEALPISTSYKSRFTALYRLNNYFTLEGVAGGLTPGANLLFNFDFK